MEEITGERRGTRRFANRGYLYYLDSRAYEEGDIYRCVLRIRLQCQGKLRVNGEEVVTVSEHSGHEPNPFVIQEAAMRQEMLRLCRETFIPLHDIYRDVSSRYPFDMVEAIPFRSLRNSMERERSRGWPEVSANLLLVGAVVRQFPLTRDLFRGTVTGDDRTHALIFATDEMVAELNTTTELQISRTITIIVDSPSVVYGVMILYTDILGEVIPLAYVLLHRVNNSLFAAVWEAILALAPGLRDHLNRVICPYRRMIVEPIRQVFGRVRIFGCWYFYCQLVLSKWIEFGLNEEFRTVLWIVLGLPLAPMARIDKGLNIVIATADRLAFGNVSILRFVQFVRVELRPLLNGMTVLRSELHSNERTEIFHRQMTTRFNGQHRNFWSFIEKLKHSVAHYQNRRNRDQFGGRQGARREELRISKLQDRLSAGRMEFAEFLEGIIDNHRRTLIDGVLANRDRIVEVGEGIHELPLPEHFLVAEVEPAGIDIAEDGILAVDRPEVEIPVGDNEIPEAEIPEVEVPEVQEPELEIPEDGAEIEWAEDDIPGVSDDEVGEPEIDAAPNSDSENEPVQFALDPCAVCRSHRPEVLFHPCRHLAVCANCNSNPLFRRQCPVCRTIIVDTTTIFFV